jgi:HlyD family secretion protein
LDKYKAALEDKTQKLSDMMKTDYGSETYTTARYDYDTALANYNYCASYTPTEKTSAVSTLEVAKAALQTAQGNYDTLKDASGIDPEMLSMDETKVETAQTMVDTAQEALDGITLKAPIDGKITSLAASAGAIVDTSTFLTISDVSHPAVTVTLDETDMDKLVVGNAAAVTFTALPGKTFTGKVSVVTPQMNSFGPFRAASGQVELDVSAVKTLETVPLGLSATIKITGKQIKDVLVIPVDALKGLNNGTYAVMVVDNSGQRTQQIVTIGIQDKTNVEITSGLKEGDVISVTTKSSTTSTNGQDGFFMDGGMPPDR